MTKIEFLNRLKDKLKGLPDSEITERLNFYGEMIDDKIEDGILEEKAVGEVGDIDEIVAQVLDEVSIFELAKQKIKTKMHLKSWEIVLLCVGSLIWFPILISAIIVAFSLYLSAWAVIVSLWAVFGSFVATSILGLPVGVIYFAIGNVDSALFVLSACFVLAGLAIFLFFACKVTTKYTAILTKKISLCIKNLLIKKENAQ